MLRIIKVGGAVVEDDVRLEALLKRVAALADPMVLVHGGGRTATDIAAALGLPTQMINGRRVTSKEMLRVVTMVYGGLVNKSVVARLQAIGVNAVGLTGADMNLIVAHRRPPTPVDYGYVGDIDKVDGEALLRLVSNGVTPVIAPLSHDGCGSLLNVNADTIASAVATAVASQHEQVVLTYCFERPGVLANPDDDSSVIPLITPSNYPRLLSSGIVSGGMQPKIENAFKALHGGVHQVLITSEADPLCHRGTTVSLRQP